MMKGMRETQANMIAGIAMTLAYGGSFVGSYMIAHNVIAPNMRANRAQAEIAMQIMEAQERGEKPDPALLIGNAGVDPDMAAEIAKQAAAEDGFQEAKMVGGNEEEDMKSIREMSDARKRNGERLDELKDKLPELAK
jgi:predicted transcriptional regulator